VSSETLIFIEMVLVLGGVLGFAFWELWKLRRDKRRSETDTSPCGPDR